MNVFGRYELHTPEPIPLTDEEYKRMNQIAVRGMQKVFKRMEGIIKSGEWIRKVGYKIASKLVCCLCCVERNDRKELRDRLKEKAGEQSVTTAGMKGWTNEMDARMNGQAALTA